MTFGKNWVVFWYFGALGFEIQRYVFGTVLFYYIWTTPQTVCNFVERRRKEEILRRLFSPNYTSLLPITPAWFVFMTQMSPKHVPTGWKGRQYEGSCFFFRRSVLPLALVGEIWTHINRGKLVFQKQLKEEFILIPKIHPWTCHTISTPYAE